MAADYVALEGRVSELEHQMRHILPGRIDAVAYGLSLVHADTQAIRQTLTEHAGRFDQHDRRFDQNDARFDRIDERLDRHDRRFDRIDERLDQHDRRFDQVDSKLDAILARLPEPPR